MSFAKEAWPLVLPLLAVAAVLALPAPGWSLAATAAGAGLLLFFRIPERRFEGDPGLVLAAADGRVTRVELLEDPGLGPGRWHRVATFLSVFDVHVQRAPIAGRVTTTRYTPGRKVAAFRENAGRVNENRLTVLEAPNGIRVAYRQIAGLLARRVVSYVQEGEATRRGQLVGLIRFGSRVDLMVPEGYRIHVRPGDRVRAGETVVASPETGAPPIGARTAVG